LRGLARIFKLVVGDCLLRFGAQRLKACEDDATRFFVCAEPAHPLCCAPAVILVATVGDCQISIDRIFRASQLFEQVSAHESHFPLIGAAGSACAAKVRFRTERFEIRERLSPFALR
jgi:hypothetical protein